MFSRFIRRCSVVSLFILSLCVLLQGCAEFQEVQVTQIGGLKILKMTNQGVEMEIGMKIKNPNNYGFTIYRSSFDIKLSGTDLGEARLSKKVRIGANSEEMHTFHISTSFSKLMEGGLGGIFALFGNRNAELQIKGNLKVGKFLIRKSIPIERKQRVSMDNEAAGSLFNSK